jgi:hypothetical protein
VLQQERIRITHPARIKAMSGFPFFIDRSSRWSRQS